MTRIVNIIKRGTSGNQLVCFPYLGGYAHSYRMLAQALSDSIEVISINPLGHGSCTRPALRSLDAMVNLYFNELKLLVGDRCVFFGHSMGAIVAFLLMDKVMKASDFPRKPSALIVSASNTPELIKSRPMATLSDSDLLRYIVTLGAIPDELIEEHEILRYFLPAYRADFLALESLKTFPAAEPLGVLAFHLYGTQDTIVGPESIANWPRYFSSELTQCAIEGDHMYVVHNAAAVAEQIEAIFMGLDSKRKSARRIG